MDESEVRSATIRRIIAKSFVEPVGALLRDPALVIRWVPSVRQVRENLEHLRGIVNNTVVTVSVITMGLIVALEVYEYRVMVEPIEVPQALADMGYTSQVLAQRLVAEIEEVQANAGTDPTRNRLEGEWSASPAFDVDWVVPQVGLSIRAMVEHLRSFFQRTTIVSGELICGESGIPVLTLRLDKRSVAEVSVETTIAQVIEDGAREVVKTLNPYVLAAYHYNRKERAKVEDLLTLITLNHAGTEIEAQAINMQGVLLSDDDNFRQAIERYGRATELDPEYEIAYVNWGHALYSIREYDGAMAKYRRAIELQPQLAGAHLGLGYALLYGKGRYNEAIAQFKRTIELRPRPRRVVLAYRSWADALQLMGKHEERQAKMTKSAQLAAQLADSELSLRSVVSDESGAEYSYVSLGVCMEVAADLPREDGK